MLVRLTIIASCLSACSTLYDKHVQWQSVKPKTFAVLHAIGYAPISLQKSPHETQRMLMAIKASKLAAYAELAEQVYGQRIDGKVTMADLLIANDQLSASVQGVIRGAKVIKTYPVGDTYATELSLNFEDIYAIYASSKQTKKVKEVTYF